MAGGQPSRGSARNCRENGRTSRLVRRKKKAPAETGAGGALEKTSCTGMPASLPRLPLRRLSELRIGGLQQVRQSGRLRDAARVTGRWKSDRTDPSPYSGTNPSVRLFY